MKVYTKTGDNGTTGLYDGSRIEKNSPILDVLGTTDELSAHIGRLLFLLRQHYFMPIHDMHGIIPYLEDIQKKILNINSIIATPTGSHFLPKFTECIVAEVETKIDEMDKCLAPLTVFIVQIGKNEMEAQAHICRTITRRVEREMYKYGNIDEIIFKFINRLSDFFFTLARYVSENRTAV